MDHADTTQQVWIFLKENDQWQHRPLFLAILELLRREGIAGATVLRGIAGYGAHGKIHTITLVELASDLPLVVTFVDRADRIEQIMPQLTAMVQVGLISVVPAIMIQPSHRAAEFFPPHLTVADVMSRAVAQVQPDTSIGEIVTLLIDRALRALPVVDADRQVVGIISDGDLLTRGALDLAIGLQQALPLQERAAQVAILADHPHRAADVMTPDPVTLAATTPLAQAAALLAERDLKRLPVVDAHSRLVGMVSRSDLLATIAEGLRQRPSTPPLRPTGSAATVGAIMLREVPTVHRDTALAETLDRLLASDKRRVIVVDSDDHVVGIITDGDLIRRAAKRARPGVLRSLLDLLGAGKRSERLEVAMRDRVAADVMTSPVIVVTPDTAIVETIRLMIAHRIKRLPVVDASGRLVGLVGRAGVLAAVSHSPDQPLRTAE
jgi:CBS domain-containing protein